MKPGWRRRRPRGWVIPAPRCWCGWYVSAAGRHDPQFLGHAATCPIAHFGWITSADQVADMRRLLLMWGAQMERVSSDPEWLLEGPWDWRAALETWAAGVTNVAVRNGWEKP